MKFLKKLFKEGKIKIDEPSETISKSYLEKSLKTMGSAKILTNAGNYNDALALTYYSMYYSVLALLYSVGIKSENHSASIKLLKLVFELDNKEIFEAKKERIDKQYYIQFNATKQVLSEAILIAEDFNDALNDFISKMTSEDKTIYLKKAEVLFEDG